MSSCAQLSQRLNLLRNLYNHVHDPDLQAEYAQQIAQIVDQMTKQGCFATTQRNLTGSVTVCSDPPFIQRTKHNFTAHLSILDSNGSIWWTFDPLAFRVGTVSQIVDAGADIGGFYDSTTGGQRNPSDQRRIGECVPACYGHAKLGPPYLYFHQL